MYSVLRRDRKEALYNNKYILKKKKEEKEEYEYNMDNFFRGVAARQGVKFK